MVDLQKARILHQLYRYKALGYEYAKEIKTANKAKLDLGDASSLENINKMAQTCYLCPLGKTRKNLVFGEGNPEAKLMFIGESPGVNEDESGKVFLGRSGKMLTDMIQNVLGLKREDVYITNIVKCRPPNNRVPDMEEAEACRSYLLEQIHSVKPDIIVTLGSTSYHHLTKEYGTDISKIRGEVYEFENAKLIPTFHPNYILRNPSSKKDVFRDILKVKGLLS